MTVEVPEILSYLITIAIGVFPAKSKFSKLYISNVDIFIKQYFNFKEMFTYRLVE